MWLLVAGFGTIRFDPYPQHAMGVPSQLSVRSTVDSAVGLPRDFVFDGTRYWGVDAADRIGYAFDTSFNCEETDQTVNPIAIAWTGHQPVVYDLGTSQNKLLFFGAETEPELDSLSLPQFRRLDRFVQKFDTAKVGTGGELTLQDVAVEGLL